MKKILIYFIILIPCAVYSQQVKSVYIKDKNTKEPLAFATIYNSTTKTGAVTNLDGNAVIYYNSENEIIEIGYIGYKKRKLILKEIPPSGIIYLSINSLQIKEVVVLAYQDQEFIAKLLSQIIKINKKGEVTETAKTTLITESTVNNVPLERQESIGNSKVSTNSIENYKIKLGRFGQNKSFNFYTLTAEDLASKFQTLTKNNNTSFPTIITHLSKKKMKKRFSLSYFKNPYGDTSMMKIGFESKSGKEFSGEVLFFTKSKKIKQVTLWIEKPQETIFFPAIETHKVEVIKLTTTLNFSENENRLNYILMDYKLDYQTPKHHQIHTSSLFTFEDYQNAYSNAYYSGKLDFDGEYFQILFHSFDERFWKENFNYAKSKRVDKTYAFFKKNGYVANFNKFSSDSLFQFLDIRIKNWDTTRLSMKELNYKSSDFGIRENDQLGEKIRYTTSDLYHFEVQSYYSTFKYKDSSIFSVIHPKIDLHKSYYFLQNDWKTEVAMNIYFDIYKSKLKQIHSQKDLNSIWELSKTTSNQFLINSNRGEKIDSLIYWNEKIKKNLGIDNVELAIKKSKNTTFNVNFYPDYYFNLGTAYLHLFKYEKALYYFNLKYKEIENKNRFFELNEKGINDTYFTEKETKEAVDLLFNRALTYLGLNQKEKACTDFQFAFKLGDKEAGKQLKIHCE